MGLFANYDIANPITDWSGLSIRTIKNSVVTSR